jgi:uncharacterized protein
MADETPVTRNDARKRYEIHVGDEVGGFLMFRPADAGRVILPHTEVDPSFKGQGLGSKLVSGALGDLARRGDIVVPRCPFVVHYLQENEVPGLVVEWPDEHDAGDSASPSEPA